MFAAAVSLAQSFTQPVIISSVTYGGKCEAGIGAFIHVNDGGWILTAEHIVRLYNTYSASRALLHTHEAEVARIQSNETLSEKERRRRLHALGKPKSDWTRDFSFWWGRDGRQLRDVKTIPDADVAIGRLDPFSPTEVAVYAQFKDSAKGLPSGTSLCRLGFPFYDVTPSYQDGAFALPPGTFPIPIFPNEGILTRQVLVGKHATGYDIGFLETSSPGLSGQSGGPIFDTKGTVWAVQSQTRHMPLGFSPPVPGGKPGQVEHQFMNVGWGTHPSSIVGLLNEFGIAHTKVTY